MLMLSITVSILYLTKKHDEPGLPDFSVAYGQNPDQNWLNWLFF